MAEFEREIIRERTMAGLEAAKVRPPGEYYSDEQYRRLVGTVHGRTPQAPPLRRRPDMRATRMGAETAAHGREAQTPEAAGPVRIVGVIDEEVTSSSITPTAAP